MKTLTTELTTFLNARGLVNLKDYLHNLTDNKDFFGISGSDPSKISYYKYAPGQEINPDDINVFDPDWRKSNCYHCKPSRLLNHVNFSQKEIEEIAAIFSAQSADSYIIKTTTEIAKHYHVNRYSKNYSGGLLYNSCMRHDSCQSSIKAYETFGGDTVKLLVVLDAEGGVLARALIWYDVTVIGKDERITYIDRVYAVNSMYEQILKDHAEDIADRFFWLDPPAMSLTVSIDYDEPMPFFDTFQSFNTFGHDEIQLCSCGRGDHSLDHTDGRSIDDITDAFVTCECCGSHVDSDEGIYINDEYYCGDCVVYAEGRYILESESVEVNGDYYHQDSESICYSDYHSEYLLADDAVYSEYHYSYLSLDAGAVEVGDDWYTEEDCQEYLSLDGDWQLAPPDADIIEDHAGDERLKSDCFEYIHHGQRCYAPDTDEDFIDSLVYIDGKYYRPDTLPAVETNKQLMLINS